MKTEQLDRIEKAVDRIREAIANESKARTTGSILVTIDMNEGGIKDRMYVDVKKSHKLQ